MTATDPLLSVPDPDEAEMPLPSAGFMARSAAHDRPLEKLIFLLSKLPGLGPRSARRAALALLKKREALLRPLSETLLATDRAVVACARCGNLDTCNPCAVCASPRRDTTLLCVVEDVEDLWAMERSGAFQGLYHILGGTLSALAGITPDRLRIAQLLDRVQMEGVAEIILALGATVEGQTTAHYLAEQLAVTGIRITRLAHGLPVGGELDYLDDGTLIAALRARRPV